MSEPSLQLLEACNLPARNRPLPGYKSVLRRTIVRIKLHDVEPTNLDAAGLARLHEGLSSV